MVLVPARRTALGVGRGPITRLSAEAGQAEIFPIRTGEARHPALAARLLGRRPRARTETLSPILTNGKFSHFIALANSHWVIPGRVCRLASGFAPRPLANRLI